MKYGDGDLPEDPLVRPVSGCMALGGCLYSSECQRFQIFRRSPGVGFNGYLLCRTEPPFFYLPNKFSPEVISTNVDIC